MSILTNADDNVVSLMDMAKDHSHTGVKGKAYQNKLAGILRRTTRTPAATCKKTATELESSWSLEEVKDVVRDAYFTQASIPLQRQLQPCPSRPKRDTATAGSSACISTSSREPTRRRELKMFDRVRKFTSASSRGYRITDACCQRLAKPSPAVQAEEQFFGGGGAVFCRQRRCGLEVEGPVTPS